MWYDQELAGVMDRLIDDVRLQSSWTTTMLADDIKICSESREQVFKRAWRGVCSGSGEMRSRKCVNESEVQRFKWRSFKNYNYKSDVNVHTLSTMLHFKRSECSL